MGWSDIKKGWKDITGAAIDPFNSTGLFESKPKGPSWQYESPDPYGGDVQWDASGRPIGRMPRGKYALDYQYEADRRTDQRRQALWSDAKQSLERGAGLLESYRPGGAAALSSGIYSQMAGMYGQQAMSMESPDLLIGYREYKQDQADYERRKAEQRAQRMAMLGTVATVAGFAFGGPVGGAAAGAAFGGMNQPGSGGTRSLRAEAGPGGMANAYAGGYGPGPASPGGPSAGPSAGPSGPGPMSPGMKGGGTFQARAGGYASGLYDETGAGMPGAPESGSAPGGGPGGPGGAFSGQVPGAERAGMKGGGYPTMSRFSSGEAAAFSMAQMPMPEEVYERWSQTEDRQQFTYAMQQSASSRLASAMQPTGLMSRMTRQA